MAPEQVDHIIGLVFFLIGIFGFFGIIFIGIKIENNFELKKLGIIKPKNKIITTNTDYNEKLKYQIKSALITIATILIIFLLCKLFGFSIKDVKELF